MSKSHLAEKNNDKKTSKKTAKSSILKAELVNDEIKKSTQHVSAASSFKTKDKNTDWTTIKPTSILTRGHKKKSTQVFTPEFDNEKPHDDEALDDENDDSFDLDSTDDILNSAELEDTKYLDDTGTDNPDNKIYALTSHDHSKDLPVPVITHLPSTPLIRDSLQLYIREVSKFPLLKPEEEIELAKRVRENGDSDAAFRIISSHLRLVVKIAMDFQRRWMQNVLDLVQEGNVGLMRAVNKFDPDKGIKFSYYATFWIKAYILKFIMDNWRMVKVGTTQAQRKLFYNLNKERQKLVTQGFDPDAVTLSKVLGVSVEQVVEMQQRLDTSDMSLDMPVSDESGSASKIDFFPALGPGIEDMYAESEIATLIHNGISGLLPKLSDKETFILENRLLTDDPVTLREIGEKYNVTRERIRQLEARLLVKLRNHLGEEIKDFSELWIQP